MLTALTRSVVVLQGSAAKLAASAVQEDAVDDVVSFHHCRPLFQLPDRLQLPEVLRQSAGASQSQASVLAFRQQKFYGRWRRLDLAVRVAFRIPWKG